MMENAGKKSFIKDFLVRVQSGEGFIEDIFIERTVQPPGLSTVSTTAQSLSGRPVTIITDLLKDDLRHSFEGFFTFRIVSSFMGGGKTSLLTYLHELIKTETVYRDFYIVNQFSLARILTTGGNQSFTIKLYCHMLAETFYELLHSDKSSVKNKAESILQKYLDPNEFNQLIRAFDVKVFRAKFIVELSKIPIQFEDLFFEVITEITNTEPQYTFAYLIDEFDGLENRVDEFQQTSMIVRSLVKQGFYSFNSKIRLFIYLVGTSENVRDFFAQDRALESLVGSQVINLVQGTKQEYKIIANKICEILKCAFKGYKNFDKAWEEIQNIPVVVQDVSITDSNAETLRNFCKRYAGELLKIYEKYFKEEPEQKFEGNARELVVAQCRQKWEKYLQKSSCSLVSATTTTHMAGHAFDCYVELLHNGQPVARCFGEAKNYDLLKAHLETFEGWLKDVNFNPEKAPPEPPDLAFMIAPGCAPLLRRKLELKHIGFIQRDKIVSPPDRQKRANHATNINTATKEQIIQAFKGTRIQKTKINDLINEREKSQFKNIDDLVSALKLTQNAKEKLQKKLDDGKICFSDS